MKTCLLLSLCTAFSLQAAEPILPFNGKNLDGWEGNMALWSVEDGAITGRTQPSTENPEQSALTHNTFLIWRGGTLKDFELTLQYRIVDGNSGIQYRSSELEAGADGPVLTGYQADFEAGTKYSGILYEEKGRGILALRGQKAVLTPATPGTKKKVTAEVTGETHDSDAIQAKIKAEDWNDYKIIAKGNHLQHFINGLQTVDVIDNDSGNAASEGLLGLQIHRGPAMVVQFRNLKIQPLD